MTVSRMDTPNIIEFATDPQLLDLRLSPAQETCLRAMYGLEMTAEQREIYQACTKRTDPPTQESPETDVIAGARSGKNSRIVTPVVCFEASFGGHERYLAHGETAIVALGAQDQRATAVAYGYIKAPFLRSPILKNLLIDEPKANSLDLVNGISVKCFPSTTGAMRGWSIPVGVLDEVAFFRLEGSQNSDQEIQQSLRRGMIAFPRTKLVKISTPYMRSGILYDDFVRAYAKDDPDLLVWVASTITMNPQIGLERLERERRLDPQRFAREYEAMFSDDVAAFVPREWIDSAVRVGRYELPPNRSRSAVMAIDPSGGGPDAFTAAICFVDGEGDERRIVQAVMRGSARQGTTPPDLEALVREYVELARKYGCSEIVSDKYAAGWVKQAFERHNIHFRHAELDRSQAYQNFEPLLAQGRIELLDHPQMIRELTMLERRPRPGGKDIVEHPRSGHDDYINSLALAACYGTVKEARPVLAAIPVRDAGDDWQAAFYGGIRRERRSNYVSQAMLELQEAKRARLARELASMQPSGERFYPTS